MHILDDSGFDSEDRLSTVFEDVSTHLDDGDADMRPAEVTFKGRAQSTEHKTAIDKQPLNTCRILQRKLELKVERAKRKFNQNQDEQPSKVRQSDTLIPISLLAIPGDNEPLVDYKSDDSDEPEEISFFPAKLRQKRKHQNQELTDTFSIQEMTLDSDLDSNDSNDNGNLDLLAPNLSNNIFDKLKTCLCCVYKN